MSYLSLYDIMTHSHFDTWHHNKISKARRANNMTHDSKSVNLTHFRRLSNCNLFSRNTSHSHDNLRRVSKSPLLHQFTCHRSGTLDWRVMKATSADSSRLANSHYFSSLFYCTLLLFYISLSFNLSLPYDIPSCRGTSFHHVSKKRAVSRLNQQDGVVYCCFLSMSFLLCDHGSIIVVWITLTCPLLE
jgi:hypothetical protein